MKAHTLFTALISLAAMVPANAALQLSDKNPYRGDIRHSMKEGWWDGVDLCKRGIKEEPKDIDVGYPKGSTEWMAWAIGYANGWSEGGCFPPAIPEIGK